MAASEMIPADTFRRYVLTNLSYWRDYVTAHLKDTEALDRGRSRIVKALSFAVELKEVWPYVCELIESFSPYMERRGYWEVWHWLLSQALETAQRSEEIASVVQLSALLARLLQRQSRFKEAIAYYRCTIRAARRAGDRYNEARACSNLGFLYSEQGYGGRAELLCCYALSIFEQLGNRHGQAHTESHLGSLYTRQGCWELARHHFERACSLWQAIGDDHGLMRGLNNLGGLCNEMGLPNEGLPYLERALDHARLTGEETEIAKIYENMSVSCRLKGELIRAESIARQAEAIFRRTSNLTGLAEVWGYLGLICLDQGKWQEAVSHLQTSLNAWRTMKNERSEIETLLYLVGYDLARENHVEAGRRLREAESLLNRYDPTGQNYYLQSLTLKCRRNLSE